MSSLRHPKLGPMALIPQFHLGRPLSELLILLLGTPTVNLNLECNHPSKGMAILSLECNPHNNPTANLPHNSMVSLRSNNLVMAALRQGAARTRQLLHLVSLFVSELSQ